MILHGPGQQTPPSNPPERLHNVAFRRSVSNPTDLAPAFHINKFAMVVPDVVIRNTANQEFEVVDAVTYQHIAGPFASFAVAMTVARYYTTGNVFQQVLDHRGRVMGNPLLVKSA